MKRLATSMLAVLAAVVQTHAVNRDQGELIVEGSDAITLGEFTVQDTTIKVKQSYTNPRVSAEYRFGGTAIALGGEFSKVKTITTAPISWARNTPGNTTRSAAAIMSARPRWTPIPHAFVRSWLLH